MLSRRALQLLLLFYSLSGLAQVVGQHYTLSKPTFYLEDFTATACAVGGNRSCWKSFSGGPNLIANAYSQWATAVDAIHGPTFYVIDSSAGSLYKFNHHSWSVVPGTPAHLSQIAILEDVSTMYVTTSDNELWQFNGTKWIDQHKKAVLISASPYGMLYIETPSFVLQRWGTPSYFGQPAVPDSWVTIPYPSGHGYIKGMAIDSESSIWLDMQDGTLLKADGQLGGGFQKITPPANMNMIVAQGAGVSLLSDEPDNNVYVFLVNMKQYPNGQRVPNGTGGKWIHLTGRLDNISGWWGFATGGGYYHFQPKELTVEGTLSGYYQCPITGFLGGLCDPVRVRRRNLHLTGEKYFCHPATLQT